MINRPYDVYKQNSVVTASPGELTLMLYNGCIKFIHQGIKAIEEQDIIKRNENVKKAQAIILEFISTLDMKYDISKQMLPLYEYMHRRLIEANIKNDKEILVEIEGLVTEFRDTWKEVIRINRQKQNIGDLV